jgi:hypothetical protein
MRDYSYPEPVSASAQTTTFRRPSLRLFELQHSLRISPAEKSEALVMRRQFTDPHSLLRWLAVALLVSCAGTLAVSIASPSVPPDRDSDIRRHETLLVGTAMQIIVEVDPRPDGDARILLNVNGVPAHIASHDEEVYFGGWMERYNLRSSNLVQFAFSDAYTLASGIAVSPRGILFASNGWLAAGPGVPTGSDTSVVAFPDPVGQNPAGAIAYLFGAVDDPSVGTAPLTTQQIGFKSDGRLLVTSGTGYGVYEAQIPPPASATCAVTMCSGGTLSFAQLVRDPTFSTIRFATDGRRKLLVLHSSGRIDEDDLATGAFERILVSDMVSDPVDMAISEEGDVFVLEQSGMLRVFSGSGAMIGSIALPASAGQPLSLTFCCHSRR